MTLYLYRIGETAPVLELEDVVSYTADQVVTADGTAYAPLAEDCELAATPDCAGMLRADWRAANPTQERRIEDLEDLLAEMLFGGSFTDGGEAE